MTSSDAACRSLYKIAEASICLMRYDVGKVLYEAYINSCDGENPGAWHGLAICLESAGRHEEARRAYERGPEGCEAKGRGLDIKLYQAQ
ncbi:hypothetical protein [Acidilobus sp. 7A]|uniref:hypothetical protein n=1 Tax=Acidilobus sp. 7A TaxID=1577685 RepID=UPI0011E4D0D7|nr:hypothetical protein [Acidilobus sp. 7A]